jgi:hypothetical protein
LPWHSSVGKLPLTTGTTVHTIGKILLKITRTVHRIGKTIHITITPIMEFTTKKESVLDMNAKQRLLPTFMTTTAIVGDTNDYY